MNNLCFKSGESDRRSLSPSLPFHKHTSTDEDVFCSNSTAQSDTMATSQQPLYHLLSPLVIKNKTKDKQKTCQMQRLQIQNKGRWKTTSNFNGHLNAHLDRSFSQLWVNVGIYGWLASMSAYLTLSCFFKFAGCPEKLVFAWHTCPHGALTVYCSCMFMLRGKTQLRALKESFHCVFLHYEMHWARLKWSYTKKITAHTVSYVGFYGDQMARSKWWNAHYSHERLETWLGLDH